MTQALAPAPATGGHTQARPRSFGRRVIARPELSSLLGAVVVFVLFFAVAPPFREPASLSTVLYSSSTIGIVAVAVALLMIGGEFDLSAGVAVTTASLTASMTAYQLSLNVWIGVAAALVLALAIGFLNGYLVMRTRLPSFLITLSTFLMLQGLNLALTKLVTGNVATDSIADMDGFASARAVFASDILIGGVAVKVTIFWWLFFVAVATWLLLRTRAGNWIYAVGGQAESARAVGVPVKWTKIALFMTVGFGAWFVGMHQLFAFDSVQSGIGIGNELLYIAAAVIGGCLLTGGYGSAIGAAIGALIYGMTTQGIVYAGWNPDWLKFFVGATLLLATLLNMWVRLRTSRR
ncbi:simple sugar transport system permease protein [Amycolatopsis bartoniae]|uniref:Xylose transport system permease protein XylH n=1 Tax=Amycolatopsis bartoniae TaxID=941986 RepID=A0A8H9IP67_9PSEU|nr:ABC transporter permease [Amycolatopsis bartoniae]MBB2937794.1 simple sugar transport system permease protein [Amycolatopsis bartoniae]TVT06536.1 ABC transporter permease [Amycolatopsis bartoniae]GHF40754.1 ribose ABC transporter permease [Amycolatopsis bartoniae]